MAWSGAGQDGHWRRVTGVAAALTLAAGGVLGGGGPAVAAGVVYAAVVPAGTQDCSSAANACSLSAALGAVAAGGVIQLITPGGDAAASRYAGNWTVGTAGTSAAEPVTIEPEPGLADAPILDGDGPDAPAGETCSTASCAGPVLTVPGGEYVTLSGIEIADGDNTTSGTGGGLLVSGTVAVTGATFTDNQAFDNVKFGASDGGAIDSGDGLLGGTGSVTVTASMFTDNFAETGGAIDSGESGGGGQVTVTASTFTGNTGTSGAAIGSGQAGGGQVTVTASTFTGNTASANGGAIESGESNGGGQVTVTASTFSGNTATDGAAIDSGHFGGGQVTVTASTFTGDTAFTDGAAIDSGDFGGSGTVAVAADVFAESCDQLGGTWDDGGYNAGTDTSCFTSPPAHGDDNAGSAAALELGSLAPNGGPTRTILPQASSPVIGLIANPATVTLGASSVQVCPATDQRGYANAPGAPCDAGAVQTTGTTSLALADSAPTGGYNQPGDHISYNYRVTNTGTTALTGLTITDPAVPGASCPDTTLAAGTAETCTGDYIVTAADVAAGKVTDTATATGSTSVGGTVASGSSTVTVRVAWPILVTGRYRLPAGAAEGYYLGAVHNTWTLLVTHPGTGKVAFTGTITLATGKVISATPVGLEPGDTYTVTNKKITFAFHDYGDIDGIKFATTIPATSITFTLDIAGQPATASQVYLGRTGIQSASGSPLTFTR